VWRLWFLQRLSWRTLRGDRRERLACGYVIIEAKAILLNGRLLQSGHGNHSSEKDTASGRSGNGRMLSHSLITSDYMQWLNLASTVVHLPRVVSERSSTSAALGEDRALIPSIPAAPATSD
jgi:hypothetical protein